LDGGNAFVDQFVGIHEAVLSGTEVERFTRNLVRRRPRQFGRDRGIGKTRAPFASSQDAALVQAPSKAMRLFSFWQAFPPRAYHKTSNRLIFRLPA